MKKLYFICTLFVITALSSCVTPPLEEMNKAQDAVIRAENDVDAVTYASDTIVRAREALTKMQSEANAKRYDAAKNLAAEAINLAERAITEGKAGLAQARDEATNLISSLKGPLAETSDALDNAKQVRNIQVDFDSLSEDMDFANKTYDDAQQSLQANSYKDAFTKARAVRSVISSVNTRLNEAAQIVSRKQ